MVFPLAKLGYLAIRQVSKPVAGWMKRRARDSHVFRKYACIPTAQLYHWSETTLRMVVQGLGKPVNVAPLNETMAVELGADILGEALVFFVAAASVTFEVIRSSSSAKAKEDELQERLGGLEQRLGALTVLCERQTLQLRQLEQQFDDTKTSPSPGGILSRLLKPSTSSTSTSSSSASDDERRTSVQRTADGTPALEGPTS